MNRLARKALLGLAVFVGVMCVNRPAEAAFITLYDGCLAGSASTFDCNGARAGTADGSLTTTGTWDNNYLTWTVAFDADSSVWRYMYSFFDETTEAPQALSHSIIELSESFGTANVLPGTQCSGGEIKTYTSADESNPGLPGSIYGIKCGGTQQNPTVVTIFTDRAPIWGDWYAKDGTLQPGNVDVYGYNAGFLVADPLAPASSGSIQSHILAPDTLNGDDDPVIPSPEPASLALFGLAMAGAGFVRRRRINS